MARRRWKLARMGQESRISTSSRFSGSLRCRARQTSALPQRPTNIKLLAPSKLNCITIRLKWNRIYWSNSQLRASYSIFLDFRKYNICVRAERKEWFSLSLEQSLGLVLTPLSRKSVVTSDIMLSLRREYFCKRPTLNLKASQALEMLCLGRPNSCEGLFTCSQNLLHTMCSF